MRPPWRRRPAPAGLPQLPAGLPDERTVIWACGCVMSYMAGGGARFAACRAHCQHRDWQAWERQIAETRRGA